MSGKRTFERHESMPHKEQARSSVSEYAQEQNPKEIIFVGIFLRIVEHSQKTTGTLSSCLTKNVNKEFHLLLLFTAHINGGGKS